MIKTNKSLGSYFQFIQSNRFLYNLSTSLRTIPFLHASSTTHITLSLPYISCHPSIISFINLTISFPSSVIPLQCSKKCSTSSTSLLSHIVQICSSLLNLHHLTVSIVNSAVPPYILLCLLHSISIHLALHLQSINLPITSITLDVP